MSELEAKRRVEKKESIQWNWKICGKTLPLSSTLPWIHSMELKDTSRSIIQRTMRLLGIHSMELKVLSLSSVALGGRMDCVESIQWNWKPPPRASATLDHPGTESIQWNWKCHSLSCWEACLDHESIQWNWKCLASVSLISFITLFMNPFNGIERAFSGNANPSPKPWIHSMELKGNLMASARAGSEAESIQWNWKQV